MKAAFKEALAGTANEALAGASTDALAGASSMDAAELLVAELRECRQRLQQLIRLMNEEMTEMAGRDFQAMDAPRSPRPLPRHRCRRASTTRGNRREKRTRPGKSIKF